VAFFEVQGLRLLNFHRLPIHEIRICDLEVPHGSHLIDFGNPQNSGAVSNGAGVLIVNYCEVLNHQVLGSTNRVKVIKGVANQRLVGDC